MYHLRFTTREKGKWDSDLGPIFPLSCLLKNEWKNVWPRRNATFAREKDPILHLSDNATAHDFTFNYESNNTKLYSLNLALAYFMDQESYACREQK